MTRHIWAGLILATMLLGAGPAQGAPQDPVPLFTFTVGTRQDVQDLVNRGLDVAAVRPVSGGFEVDVVGHQRHRASLQALPFPSYVRIPDLIARAQAVLADYRDLADYDSEMQAIAAAHPTLARLWTIGTSIEGRAIHALEMASPVTSEDGRPEAAFFGLHHAREWPSGEMVMNLATDLAQKYGADARVTKLLKKNRIWLVPVVNPDGFVYSRTVNALWRKNRRNNGNGTFGVDNNRNYAFQWGGPGSSNSKGDETYRGSARFSEPETAAVRDLFLGRHIMTALSNHTYSSLNLFPWAYTTTNTPESATFTAMGNAIAAINGYTSGQTADILYLASGDTDDWVYGTLGGFMFTFEHGCCEFHPPFAQVAAMYASNYPAFLYLAEQAKKRSSLLKGTITDAVTGAGLQATLTLSRSYAVPLWGGGTDAETKTTTLPAKANGRYKWRILPSKMPLEGPDPGYTLAVSAPGYVTQTVNVTIARQQKKAVNVALTPTLVLAPAGR